MINAPTIIDSSNWSEALSAILSGVRYLDSIILFDVGTVHLTLLGFDIAVLAFGIVWNTVGLWHYDFDESISDMSDSTYDSDISDEEFFSQFTPAWDKDVTLPDSDIDISAEDDDDYM